VVTVGPAASGKSAWAAEWFRPEQVVSSDRLRALVGTGEHDQRASPDAFAVLDDVVARRLARKLTTVIDSTALEADRRSSYLALAARHGVPCYAVAFATPAAECRARNAARADPVPEKVITQQAKAFAAQRDGLDDEGFAAVLEPGATTVVPSGLVGAADAAGRQAADPARLRFGLQISRFSGDGGPEAIAGRLAAVARAAEAAGFASVHVMDHFLQIPVVGREWEDMLDSYTTLGYLAAATERVRLGALVTGVTYRNLAHLAKIVATLDVLSQGRAICGLGTAWFAREHELYGWRFPPVDERYALLEDALELLPLMWGKGSPSFTGRTTSVAECTCYPRPVQDHVPIWIGGSGERRTLRLVAEHADACNLFGDPPTVAHKVDVLRRHCEAVDRDPRQITVSHLSVATVIEPGDDRIGPEAATVVEHVGRYREWSEAGVEHAIVGLGGPVGPDAVEQFAPVVAAFS
jgi:F420-dependent oxidoreductase-like protein